MPFQKMRSTGLLLAVILAATLPVAAQTDIKTIMLKHLKTDRKSVV